MNKALAAFALLLLISFTVYSFMKTEQENDSLKYQVAELQSEVNKLTLWKEDALRREPWLRIARAEMTELKQMECNALSERIKQRKHK